MKKNSKQKQSESNLRHWITTLLCSTPPPQKKKKKKKRKKVESKDQKIPLSTLNFWTLM